MDAGAFSRTTSRSSREFPPDELTRALSAVSSPLFQYHDLPRTIFGGPRRLPGGDPVGRSVVAVGRTVVIADPGLLVGDLSSELAQFRNFVETFLAEQVFPDFVRIRVVQDESVVLNDPYGSLPGL